MAITTPLKSSARARLKNFLTLVSSPLKSLWSGRDDRLAATRHASKLIETGDARGLKSFLNQWRTRLDVFSELERTTLMGQAAALGRVHCAKVLLAHGYTLSKADHWGRRPLEIAMENGQARFSRWAFNKGAKAQYGQALDQKSTLYHAALGANAACIDMAVDRAPDPLAARAHVLFHLVNGLRRRGSAERIIDLLGRPKWVDALPLADELSIHGAFKPLYLLGLAASCGAIAEQTTQLLLRVFKATDFDPRQLDASLSQALLRACAWSPEQNPQALLETLWSARVETPSIAAKGALLAEATSAKNADALSWLLSKVGDDAAKRNTPLLCQAIEKGDERSARLWLEALSPLTDAEWGAPVSAALTAPNLEIWKTLDAFNAPLDQSWLELPRPLERLAMRSDSDVFNWLLDRLAIADPSRLRRLSVLLQTSASAYGGANPASLSAIDRMIERHELNESTASSTPRRSPAPRL